MFYVVVPIYWFNLDGFQAGTIGLTIYTSAFIAETVRSGIQTVPKVKQKQDYLLVLPIQKSCVILFTASIQIVIPPLGNQFINLVKLIYFSNRSWFRFDVSRRLDR